MRINATVAILLLAFVFNTRSVEASEKEDIAQLEQLITQVEKILPAGWTAAFEVANEPCGRSGPSVQPLLVVKSSEKLPVEYSSSIGRPAAGADPSPYVVHDVVKIEFAFVPYMSPSDYATARKKNEDLDLQRRTFEERRLNKKQSNYKGGFNPATYPRQTGDKSPLVREYAFVWLNTEPRPMPTHHYGSLAVATHDLRGTTSVEVIIHDAAKNQQFKHILDGLEKIFVPYETRQ